MQHVARYLVFIISSIIIIITIIINYRCHCHYPGALVRHRALGWFVLLVLG